MDHTRQWRLLCQSTILKQITEEYSHTLYAHKVKLPTPLFSLTDSKTRLASWDEERGLIEISWHLIENYSWDIVVEVLKHEMAHQYVSFYLHQQSLAPHGEEFIAACEKLGVASWAMRASVDSDSEPFKTWKDDLDRQQDSQVNRIQKRAEKLLALAQSDNEHEASLAMQRVQELYLRHHIEQRSEIEGELIVSHVLCRQKKRLDRYESVISHILLKHFYVEIIMIDHFDAKCSEVYKAIEITGRRSHVLMAEYVFFFLVQTVESLWQKHRREHKLPASSRLSFMLGVLRGFDEKLQSSKKDYLAKESSENALIELKDPAVMKAYARRYPRIQRSYYGRRRHDSGAFNQGKKKGAEINLRRPISSGSSEKGGFLTG